ncbi:uncharacterized protein LOC6526311 isoform X3 [Drosophila yakuba]|uniref:Uncharacterized protein, isoform B n=1 Tax=Drosophila yakuba TaxID=7245 RepID=A0A0R1DPU0_DROYA|nr:uncharacterized protein LOC6526311 isoform X3 [Drosophila yakuba]KRJ97040.1 uncharacterized protein Dyak_GE16858, isoform B [Drosophila yakuba]
MSPKYHNFEIALVYFLLLIPWPPTNVIRILCSRDNSRLVRKIVRSKWTPILDKHQVKLPLECPLHPFRDVFAPRQDAKQRDRPTQWTCRKCGKSFYQEKHLDLHFDTRHKSIINQAEDAVCLADFCDIMRCEVFETEDASSLKFGDQHIVTDIEVWGDSLGQNSALAKANAAYLSLIPRTSTLGASRAAKVQNRQLLQDKPSQASKQNQSPAGERTHPQTHHHPRDRASTTANPLRLDPSPEDGSAARPRSAGEKLLNKLKELGKAHLKPAADPETSRQNETGEEEDEKGSGQPEGSGQSADEVKTEEGSGANGNGNKARANCKPEELSKLKNRCEMLLRSCIGGLLLSMSDQAFKEMEDEMNKAVCWYLTCDRYWEDGPLEPRAFPWGLIVILIFVLSTGICFCYYIIWILFDHLFQLRRNDNQREPLLRPGIHRRRREHLHARSSSGSSLPCGLCHAARPRPGRRRDSWSAAATAASASGAAVLLPTAAAAATAAAGGIRSGFVPGAGAVSPPQSAALHRRSASGGANSGHTHPRGRSQQFLQRQHAVAPSGAAFGTASPPATSSLDEPGLPTGHFRPTRLYK